MLLSNTVYQQFFLPYTPENPRKCILKKVPLFGVVRFKSILWSSGHRRREFKKNSLNETPLVNNVKKLLNIELHKNAHR